jgi:hypothetical protein
MKLFRNVLVLEHPRFIMQYRLKRKEEYTGQYLVALKEYRERP